MTERRTTITRNWRPAGTPARRRDDFVEVPNPPAPAPAPQPERRDMESRMQNWVRWCTTWGCYPRDGGEDSAARACRIAYEAKFGPAPSASTSANTDERREVDEQDAMRIERGLWRLPNVQRDILRLHYVRRREWFDICRMVGIAVRRRGFAEKLAASQAAIAQIVDCEQ